LSEEAAGLGWGHINVNVSDLDRAIAFYEKLGFSVLLTGIPYLDLEQGPSPREIPEAAATALGLEAPVAGRGCIMQLGKGFPMLDLTELSLFDAASPLANRDRGIVRICLASRDLARDYARLMDEGVEFLSPPTAGKGGSAEIAVCRDPDGTLIELIELDLDRWVKVVADSA